MLGKLVFHEPPRFAHAGQPHVADVGLRRDEIDRDLLPKLFLAQIGIQDECHFVGRAETGGALRRTHDDRAGIFQETLVGSPGLFGMVHVADRLGVAAGTESGHGAEIQLRPRRDDEIVIGHLAFRRDHPVLFRFDPVGRRVNELDAFFLQHRPQRKADVLSLAPSHRHPGIRRHKVEGLDVRDHRHLMLLVQQRPRLIGCRQPSDRRPDNCDSCHNASFFHKLSALGSQRLQSIPSS